jgi:hypothetical protein
MKTWAILNNENLVVNCILADTFDQANLIVNGVSVEGELVLPETLEFTLVEYFIVEPGWSRIDGQWVKPTE